MEDCEFGIGRLIHFLIIPCSKWQRTFNWNTRGLASWPKEQLDEDPSLFSRHNILLSGARAWGEICTSITTGNCACSGSRTKEERDWVAPAGQAAELEEANVY